MKRIKLTPNTKLRLAEAGLLLLAAGFLFLPFGGSKKPAPKSDYDSFYAMNRTSSLSADELEPYRYTVEVPEIEKADAGWSIEAESAEIPGGALVLRAKPGFSGLGYVCNLPNNTESALEIPVTVPYSQHYAVTVCVSADKPADGALRIDGERIAPLQVEGSSDFIRVTFYGLFLTNGEHTVAIDTGKGRLDIDYIELSNDTSVYDVDFRIEEDTCNPNASAETKKLYRFLRDHWGSEILTGQYVSDASNPELEAIYKITGQLPAIRFSELGTDHDLRQIENATDWSVYMHGIVGLVWNWGAPDTGSVYANETQFDLGDALRFVDVNALAAMPYEDAEKAADELQIPHGAADLLRDIDRVAESLRKLANMDIPVLWRPLHEAGGGWYWWGASGEHMYQQLWRLVYQRLTNYHGLNNLIWIWNGQSTSYLVSPATYDIASVDVYLPPDHAYGSRCEQFLSLARITGGRKLLALSECSALPDLRMMNVDRSVWSFFGLWYGEYLLSPDGTFSDQYYSSNDLYNLYNSGQALSLNDFLSLYQ